MTFSRLVDILCVPKGKASRQYHGTETHEMDVEEVKGIVWELAQSQGFYGRLGRDMDESDGWEQLAEEATKAGCKGTLDFVLWIEGG